MKMKSTARASLMLAAMFGGVSIAEGCLWAQSPNVATTDSANKTVAPDRAKIIAKAVAFLRTAQAEDGSFSSKGGPGVTGLVVAGLISADVPVSDPIVQKGLQYLLKTKRDDGGLYAEGSRHANYETCLAMMAFTKANTDGKYKDLIAGAQQFVKQQQWDEGEGATPKDFTYGGAGYGSKSRPDLSNTSFFIDALRSSGVGEDDPAIQKALAFVSRCQNVESPKNDTPFAGLVNDGGFYYTPAAGGDSMAGKNDNGGLRSYASMTYAGLKSMIFAGVDKDDFRVKAARSFLQNNYSVTSNPGMGSSGLYYYLHTMSKALQALGEKQFEAKDGKHDWQAEVLAQLASNQAENGSWTNPDARWMEGDPNLVTGYVLLTLANLK